MVIPYIIFIFIGNGFDRYHGADSTYMDFRSYLLKHNDFVVEDVRTLLRSPIYDE